MYKCSINAKLQNNFKIARYLFKNKNVFNFLNFPFTDSQTLVKMQNPSILKRSSLLNCIINHQKICFLQDYHK